MSELKNIYQAMAELYPSAVPNIDWLYVAAEPEAVMQEWNTAKLGTLDMGLLKARDAEIAARPKPKAPKTPLQFKELFTQAERQTMRTVAKSDAEIEDYLDLLNSATEVKIEDSRVQYGLNRFVNMGVIKAARKMEIEAAFV